VRYSERKREIKKENEIIMKYIGKEKAGERKKEREKVRNRHR
jgi:hypothetical protein